MIEKKIEVNGLARRIDLAVCNPLGKVAILVECKAPEVPINQIVFDQIARYNMEIRADFLMVTNGITHIYCQMDFVAKKYIYIPDLPANFKLPL